VNFQHGRVLSVSPAPRLARHVLPLLIWPLLAAGAAPPADLDPAWSALANLRPKDVLRQLDDTGQSRPAQLARAAAWMSLQPATDENMRTAEAVFTELAKGDDAVAAEAGYLRARLHQLHYAQPDYARAAELYRELAARQPHSHWAQLGLVKLAMLELYLLPGAAPAETDRLAPAEAVLAQIEERLLQRDLHLQIGRAGMALQQPLPRLLPHLVAADRIGGISGTAREDLIVQIGVLSLRAGQAAQAREYFERYLREYPTNARAFSVKLQLAEANQRLAKEGGR
jgi:tetratricopeptide (TPR) repeat protein